MASGSARRAARVGTLETSAGRAYRLDPGRPAQLGTGTIGLGRSLIPGREGPKPISSDISEYVIPREVEQDLQSGGLAD
jgi:hypothetical protein